VASGSQGERLGQVLNGSDKQDRLRCNGVLGQQAVWRLEHRARPGDRPVLANVRFDGVKLVAVLKKHNVRIDPEAKFMTADGKDNSA